VAPQPQSAGKQDDGIVTLAFWACAVYCSDELGKFLFASIRMGWRVCFLALTMGIFDAKSVLMMPFPKQEPEKGT